MGGGWTVVGMAGFNSRVILLSPREVRVVCGVYKGGGGHGNHSIAGIMPGGYFGGSPAAMIL